MPLRRFFAIGLILACLFSFPLVVSGETSQSRFSWPVKGAVLTHFKQKYLSISDGKEKTHYGIDIKAEAGEGVLAASEGQVSFAGFTPAGGKTVAIIHSNGYKTTYLQLSEILVNEGNQVQSGQLLGKIAEAGDASFEGSHLHFGVKEIATDNYIDPESLLPLISAEKEPSPSSAKTEAVLTAPTIVAPAPTAPATLLRALPVSVTSPAHSTATNDVASESLQAQAKSAQVKDTSVASKPVTLSSRSPLSLLAPPGSQLTSPNSLGIKALSLPKPFDEQQLPLAGFISPESTEAGGEAYQNSFLSATKPPSLESLKITLAIFALLIAFGLLARQFYLLLRGPRLCEAVHSFLPLDGGATVLSIIK